MVNYSIVMRSNPMDADAAKKAYASAQYSEVMDINRFAEHIASHGCVYKRADIVAILTMAVDCIIHINEAYCALLKMLIPLSGNDRTFQPVPPPCLQRSRCPPTSVLLFPD